MNENQQILPLRLYNIDNQIIPILSVSNSYTYFIRSYRNFSIKVLAGKCTIYSVTLDVINGMPTPIIDEGTEFINDKQNTSYTLLLESDAIIECDDIVYQIKLLPDNEITEENQHYPDLLYNYDLPSFKELEPAILDGSKRELIKRLLLDFRSIISKKGTILSIEKFFNFLGLNSKYLHIWEEYLHEENGNILKTTQPNKETDYKSGDYHVLFDNWEEPVNDRGYTELDKHNLPIRKINIQDFDAFFKALVHAIALADRYFTLQEQDISFFGIGFSANLPEYFGITGNMSEIWEQDIYNFRKKISIDIKNYFNQSNFEWIVKNTLQYKKNIYRTEIKTYSKEESVIEKDLFWIEKEFYDDEDITPGYDIKKIKRSFGKVLQIDINCRNCYYEVFIENVINPFITIKKDKSFSISDTEHLEFVTATNGEYRIIIDIYDQFNNRERFVYNYELSYDILHVDFEIFNSIKILDKPNNGLNQDVESPWIVLTPENIYQYILPIELVPDDLSKYYDNGITQENSNLRYLSVNKRYELLEANSNIILDEFSETLITKFVDNWLDIYTIKLDENLINKKLVLRIFDPEDCKWKFINYDEISKYKNVFDVLFITIMDIIENQKDLTKDKVPYIFITTTDSSLQINKLFDFCFIEPDKEYTQEEIVEVSNIYNLDKDTITNVKIPINFDFQLFTRKSKLLPDFKYYVSNKVQQESPQVILGPVIESVFPRLINIEKAGDLQVFYLKLGDIIACRCNDNYLVNYSNVVWKVYNSFTNELLYETKDLMLKYRIDENTCYDIELEYIIEGLTHKITKKSVFSSFDVIL